MACGKEHPRPGSLELDLAMVLGTDHEAAAVTKVARDIFEQIGAHVFAQRLAQIMDGPTN